MRTIGDDTHYSIINISQNTEKNPGELMLLHHHHHHVVPQARISLTLSRHFPLSFIASGRSSGLHPVSSHSCCMYVLAGSFYGISTFVGYLPPYVGVHRSTSHPAESCVPCSSKLDNFFDGRQVAVQLVPRGVLPPGLV